MKNNKTYYLLILDKSGSMQDCVNETISGFNEQLEMIEKMRKKFPEQEFFVSLTTFSDEVNHVFEQDEKSKVKKLDKELYQPGGTTALLDAIGKGVLNLDAKINKELAEGTASAVVVILTDGCENASKLFNWQGIRQMIREMEATGSWTFSFMGASEDAIEVASKMSIKSSNAMHYNKAKMGETMNHICYSLTDYFHDKQEGRKAVFKLNEE